jgi:uncharacterized RDD family membrane protein YckC
MKSAGGVYFRKEDYASFWLRLLIGLIDFFVIGVFGLLALALLVTFPTRMTLNLTLASFTGLVFCYMVLLKRSSIRTIGYRIGRVRIVGQDGQTVSLSALTMRLLFAGLGPFNWFLDLIWLSGDRHRQSLGDKFAHTYVVRLKAQSAGTGKLIFRPYEICGWNFLFQEVEAQATAGPS